MQKFQLKQITLAKGLLKVWGPALCFSILLFPSFVFSEIQEAYSLEEIYPYVDDKTLLVFDIDQTLLKTKQSVGGDVWFQASLNKLQGEGASFEEALAHTLPTYMNLQNQTETEVVEAIAPDMIHQFQKKGVKVVAVTARSTELAYTTIRQLKENGIDLNRNPIRTKRVNLSTDFPLQYVEGILFVESHHKGEKLMHLLEHSQFKPKKIIFIDDNLKYLKQLEQVCSYHYISYQGFHYLAAQCESLEYDDEVATLQLKYFNEIVSNEDAEKILFHRQSQ